MAEVPRTRSRRTLRWWPALVFTTMGHLSLACASEPPAVPKTTAAPPPPGPPAATRPQPSPTQATSARVTVLSTSKADVGTGEWGFAALVEVDGTRVLFDTGAKPDTVLRNAAALGVDLATIEQVVLSHHHDDHVGGLTRLRASVIDTTPEALRTVHVARGMFEPRHVGASGREVNKMMRIRDTFESTGGEVIVHEGPTAIAPGVWVTGPVPRLHPERNWSGRREVPGSNGWHEDQLAESQALIVDTSQGLLVLSGCGHAGVVNIATYAREAIREAPLHLVGGFHLHRANAAHLAWTLSALDALDLRSFYGAHCTGSAAVKQARSHLPDSSVAEVAVGWSFALPSGN